MPDHGSWWLNRAGDIASATSSKTSPRPDFPLALDVAQAPLTGAQHDATVNDMMTMADDQDLAAVQSRAAELFAEGDKDGALRLLRDTSNEQFEAEHGRKMSWWDKATSGIGNAFSGIGDGISGAVKWLGDRRQDVIEFDDEHVKKPLGGEGLIEASQRAEEKFGAKAILEGTDQVARLVDQVIATPIVAATMAGRDDFNIGEVWGIAGDDVTAGQAFVDMFAGGAEAADWYRAGFDELGRPRDAAYAELRASNAAYNISSGAIDFTKAWFADPLVIAGKGARIARAHSRGDFDNMGRTSAARVKSIVSASDEDLARTHIPKWDVVGQNAKRLRERMLTVRDEVRAGKRDIVSLIEGESAFKDSPAGAALFAQASRARKRDPETMQILDEFDDELFRDFVGSSVGHGPSQERLALRGAEGQELQLGLTHMRETKIPALDDAAQTAAQTVDRIADDGTLNSYQRYWRTMNAEQDFWTKMDKAEEAREVLRGYESHLDFVTNAATRSYDQLRSVPGGGRTLAGQGFDVATHVYRPAGSNDVAEAYTKAPIAALRKRPGVVDFHRPGSLYESMDRYFKSGLAYGQEGKKNGISRFLENHPEYENFEHMRRDLLNKAANAVDENAQLGLAHKMEDVGVEIIAAKHGLGREEALEIASHIRGRREGLFGDILSRANPDDKTLSFMEDGVKQTLELTPTQLSNSFFAVDLRALDGILSQHGHAIGEGIRDSLLHAGDKAGEKIGSLLESYNHLWKPMVLFRLGYPLRTVADDFARAFAMTNNMADMLRRLPEAMAIGTANMVPRTANAFRRPFKGMAQRRWEVRNADILKGDASLAQPDLARQRAIQQRLEGIDRFEQQSLRARANGRNVPRGARHEFANKLDRIAQSGDEFAVDVASGRKLKASQEVYDFSLSRARAFNERPTGVQLATYARENSDRLSHADGVLVAKKMADGWRVGVGRKGPGMRKLNTLQQRAMTTGVHVGEHSFGAPAEPGQAENFTFLSSSDQTWMSMARSHESNVGAYRAKMIEAGRSTVASDGMKHAENWANLVNRHYIQDPLVRRVVDLGPEETARWLRNTGEGRQVARRLQITDAAKYTDGVANQANVLLPDEALRARVIAGEKLAPDELAARMQSHPGQTPAALDGPAVDLATKNGHFSNQQRGLVDKIYHALATVPTDTLVRHPFFRAQYEARLRGFVDTLEPGAAINDATKKLMERQAREWSLKQTRRYMFSLSDNTDLVHTARFMMPFMGAWQETMTRWLTILTERPEQIARIWGQGWQNLGDLWFLQMVDDDGRSQDDPEHGELTNFRVPVPKWFTKNVMSKLIPGEAAELIHSVSLNKEGMNAILQGSPWWLPSGGPLMQFPAKALLGNQPHLADENSFSAFMYKYLFPTGVPDNASAILPAGWHQQARRMFMDTEDPVFTTLAANVHKLDVQRWEAEGRPTTRPTESEAIDKAKSIQAVMVAGRFMSPTSFQIEVGDPNSQVPAQFFIDAARRVQAEEPDFRKALERYVTEYGDDQYAWWVATSQSKTGVPATSAAFKAQGANEDLISDNPEVGLAIVGLDTQSGEFNYGVFQSQETSGDRERLSPEAAQARAESEAGWREWHKLQLEIDAELVFRGIVTTLPGGGVVLDEEGNAKPGNITRKGAEDLVNIQRHVESQLRATYPGWARDRDQFDKGKGYAIVNSLQAVVDSGKGPDPRFRPDWAGIHGYLELHREVGAELDRRYLAGGSRDINTGENVDLKGVWDHTLGQLVQGNLMFADLYHRMLDRHELTMGSG